jgi:hypothetical protein
MVFLEHLDVWVFRQAVLTDGWEVGGLPPRPVEVLLNLRGHGVDFSPAYALGAASMAVMLDLEDCKAGMTLSRIFS